MVISIVNAGTNRFRVDLEGTHLELEALRDAIQDAIYGGVQAINLAGASLDSVMRVTIDRIGPAGVKQ